VSDEEVVQSATEAAQTPVGQKVVKDVSPEGYVKANVEAAQMSAKETSKKPIDEALDIAAKRGAASTQGHSLPVDLRGSKPRYGYKDKNFQLKFQDPRDLAAYMLSQTTKNKAHDRFLEYYKNILPVGELQAHAARVRNFIKGIAKDGDPEKGPITIPSQVSTDAGRTVMKTRTAGTAANRSVSVVAGQKWLVHAKAAAKKAGAADHKAWLDDMSHEDFVKETHEFFYPEELKKAGLDFFESGHVKHLGAENPNFLAFMYNFRDRMPKEFQDKLRDEFVHSNKVQKWLNVRRIDESQLLRYAHGMKAHVYELLTTEKFKDPNARGEVGNIYRSTYGNMVTPTEWQNQLHIETIEKERSLIIEMFKGKPKQKQEALTAYNILAGKRAEAFSKGEQAVRLKLQDDIDQKLIDLSGGGLEKWEY
jgi:hypothetical protein